MGTIIVLGILAAIVAYAIMLYNNLVQVKHNVSKAWANIDVLLKQRHDELPKLVETCKQYMKFEQETLTKVMEARSKVFAAREAQNIPQLGQAEGALRATLGNLFALAEAYPDLKTNQTFQQLQTRISSLENAHRRPPRVLQRVREHQQRAHRAVPGLHHRRHVQLQAGASP